LSNTLIYENALDEIMTYSLPAQTPFSNYYRNIKRKTQVFLSSYCGFIWILLLNIVFIHKQKKKDL
ncbi:MAG: hypothetical protein K6A05_05630, partial [Lachnospiraceae bacterium]|nr:hypothetical protein [Lachnospiraceae bacterium]